MLANQEFNIIDKAQHCAGELKSQVIALGFGQRRPGLLGNNLQQQSLCFGGVAIERQGRNLMFTVACLAVYAVWRAGAWLEAPGMDA